MSSLAPGRINVFGLGTDHALYWKYKVPTDDKAWTAYHGSGGKWVHEPVTVSRVLNEISVFMVDEAGALKQSDFDLVNNGDLGPWKNLGGKLSGPPAIAKRKGGILHIFHIGGDHALHHKAWDGVVYSPADEYEKLAGEFTHTPTAVSTGRDDVSVFAITLDNRLCHYQWKSSSGWGSAETLPGHWADSPKAVSDQVGSMDVFGLDAGGNVTHAFCRNGKDWSLQRLSGSFRSLDAISLAPGCVDFFALGDSKTIFHRTLINDSWQEWEDLKGIMTKPPTAVTHTPGHLGVFGLGEGGVLFYKVRDEKTGGWGEWINLGGFSYLE
ncbi:hypothetical protein JB92DRAFT_233821 [Gautieria morchelliformis]|nr:hypothetical protein JB92DRAFT_233821 [Gautieria morchelliformis]